VTRGASTAEDILSFIAAKKKSAAKKSSTKGKAKVGKVMHEYKRGQLKSGSGQKVKNPRQAIAIGLNEARRSGADIPPKGKGAAKKKSAGTSKKAGAKKSPAKKSSAKKSSAKKTSRKRS
jgi:hypothetical protein